MNWRKSSFSGEGTDANCVEVASLASSFAVRDSKSPAADVLVFPTAPWGKFLDTLI